MKNGKLSTGARLLGALALLVVGGVHFQVYWYEFYSAIPTIGPLFLVSFVAATALGLFLVVPIRPPGRVGVLADRVAAIAGVAVSAGAFVGLIVSEQTSLFGFNEHGYRFVIVLALASEAMAVAMLSLFLARERADDRAAHASTSDQGIGYRPGPGTDPEPLPTADW